MQQQQYHHHHGTAGDLYAENARLREALRLTIEATQKTTQQQDSELLRLIHANERLWSELAAAQEQMRQLRLATSSNASATREGEAQ